MEREPGYLKQQEKPITDSKDFIAWLIKEVPKYTADMLDKSQDDDNTTLRQFLENKTEGGEWTDPLGFKVSIKEGVYVFESIPQK
ncbi:MAG: hypothetical protein V1688_00435 [bacterium]